MTKDRLVCGIENDKMRRSLLREDKLGLQKAIELQRQSSNSNSNNGRKHLATQMRAASSDNQQEGKAKGIDKNRVLIVKRT